MNKDLATLLKIWRHTILQHQQDMSPADSAHAAQTAYGYGAYLSDITADPLLQTIHENFGVLEGPDTPEDPDNQKLWDEQARLIEEVSKKYS